ncbi:MAG: glucose/galactose MFS transporter, partial [Paraglaciecola chathamensis]
LLAGVMIATAIGFKFLKLPTIKAHEDAQEVKSTDSIWSHKALIFGTVAIFFYVGAEVSIGSFLVNYFSQPDIAGLNDRQASHMVSYYWGAAMIGRFVGAALTRIIAPIYVLAFNSAIAIILLFTTMNTQGELAMWTVISIGFFNSIMFPTIFTLAIRGLGPLTGRGSGLLCQAIVGGAILPLIQGYVADISSVQFSFIVPVAAYIYIAWYALVGSKLAPAEIKQLTQEEQA